MVPLLVLLGSFATLLGLGAIGVGALASWVVALRCALALMFLLTASAHWGKRRADLIRMVPRSFPRPDLLVTLTGVLEIAGAVGLLVPSLARWAAAGLALMMVAIFPANVHAARAHLSIGSRPVTALPLRTLLQLVFIGATTAVVIKG
jgi:uncharacterized membrane protein